MSATSPEVNFVLIVSLLPAILGLVNFVKEFGLSGKWLTLAAMAIGILSAVAYALVPPGVFQIAFDGIVLGLAAAGLYDITSKKPTTPPAAK